MPNVLLSGWSRSDLLKPGSVVLLLCVGQVVLWSCAFATFYSAPEIDSAEQFVWAFSLENGYWKHPPAPSWIMHGLIWLFGPSVGLPFVAAQVCIVVALALGWRLGCEFMSARRSLIAMALTSLVIYHNVGGDNFNHSTALLPFQAAMTLCFYLATRRGELHLWALAGLFAGLSMLVKYVALLPIGGLLLYVLCDRQLHTRGVLFGFSVAATVFATVLLPHAIWLQRTDFLPFQYAHAVAKSAPEFTTTVRSVADFCLIQSLRMLPMLIGLLYVLPNWGQWRSPGSPVATIRAGDRLFLWLTAGSPLVLTIAFALATNTELQSRWGSNAFLLSGLVAVGVWNTRETTRTLHRTLVFVTSAHLVLALTVTIGKTALAGTMHHRTRANFPGAVLAKEASAVWAAHTSAPLRIVVSDIWLGGNIVANTSDRVAVLIDGRTFKSPWVKDQAIDDCGALVLDDLTSPEKSVPNAALEALMARSKYTGLWNLPWAVPQEQATADGSGIVRWGIIEPKNERACDVR